MKYKEIDLPTLMGFLVYCFLIVFAMPYFQSGDLNIGNFVIFLVIGLFVFVVISLCIPYFKYNNIKDIVPKEDSK